MKKNLVLLPAILLCVSGGVSAQNLKSISQEKATRIVKTLSADDMQGRASFTPGGEKAADFIASEFKKTKLKYLPGANSYKQTFKVYRVTPTKLQVKLNGETITEDKLFASTTHKDLNWQVTSNRKIVTITESDDIRKTLSDAYQLEEDVLVLVHPAHVKAFANYQRYLSRGGIVQKTGKGASKVFILTDVAHPQDYAVAMENKIEELQLTNVAGMIEGKRKDEYVVFSGHYDHIGTHKPIDGDTIANGADDDASGTTAMMLLADFYKKQRKPERTIIFVAFAAEEIGGYGSKHFSEQLNPDQIMAMFNIEMVGKPSKFGPNSAYLTGFEKSNLGELMQKRLQGTTYSIYPDPYPKQNLFYRSDNATLARLGVPAHTISSVQIDQDKTYHTVNDEFEMLDMAHLTSMIKGIALGSYDVVFGKATPTRVDKSQVQ
ncbi:M20/M25/M40 family metallo-hydrolase [Pontibacter sp. KCTC 32443]|uniref:M20/M25/M40 family metallo-hydrolase n=1 Tax=Pontibacter TaxID=323449 RepID=UPI00164EBD90|nr:MULTISPECIES: M20/M25/M40 family metallo-hydrolase [Pontibacter]MBC5775110.1 M20/M25/M40 family metallo-hydrolase [Pontibacter sp. KCTC 32443]